ncbi:uncharacterized protein LOC143288262 [Babylonia areolata]|uniref:uncharacterized protein LOC143288262 n=1 Tax=Babylonia areolata TaxID=304850 RepID=UPI003FD1EEB2
MARDLHHILPQIDVTDYSHVPLCDVHSSSINRCTPSPDLLHVPSYTTPYPLLDFASPSNDPSSTTAVFSESEEDGWSGSYDFVAKIIMLGDYGVGKSSLLRTLGGLKNLSWCRCRAFRANELVELECLKNEKKVLIRIMDTGGQERFRSMTSSYFRGAHGCLLTFSVTNEDSFDSVINWFHDLSKYASPYSQAQGVTSLVVGTLPTSMAAQRRVSAERAFRLAESLNLTYCETHVRDEQMILFILRRLVNNVIVDHQKRPSLTITIMPSLGNEQSKKRLKCCKTS